LTTERGQRGEQRKHSSGAIKTATSCDCSWTPTTSAEIRIERQTGRHTGGKVLQGEGSKVQVSKLGSRTFVAEGQFKNIKKEKKTIGNWGKKMKHRFL